MYKNWQNTEKMSKNSKSKIPTKMSEKRENTGKKVQNS